jgi:hypothetical protein
MRKTEPKSSLQWCFAVCEKFQCNGPDSAHYNGFFLPLSEPKHGSFQSFGLNFPKGCHFCPFIITRKRQERIIAFGVASNDGHATTETPSAAQMSNGRGNAPCDSKMKS